MEREEIALRGGDNGPPRSFMHGIFAGNSEFKKSPL